MGYGFHWCPASLQHLLGKVNSEGCCNPNQTPAPRGCQPHMNMEEPGEEWDGDMWWHDVGKVEHLGSEIISRSLCYSDRALSQCLNDLMGNAIGLICKTFQVDETKNWVMFCIYIYRYIRIHVCIFICLYTNRYTHTHVYIYIYIDIYI